jgi:hypothetical protein
MQDRTGELCPVCKKGKLYPSGIREVLEPGKKPDSGELHRENTEYECDNCKHKTNAFGVNISPGTISIKAEAKVFKNKSEEN